LSAADQFVVHIYTDDGDPQPVSSSEVFVLRQSDVFGDSVLFAYAHLVQTALELDSSRSFLTVEERHSLSRLADDIHETAVRWMTTHDRKLPG